MPPRHPLRSGLSHKHLELTSPQRSTIKRGGATGGSGEPPDKDHMPPRHPLEKSTIKRRWRNWRRSGELLDKDHMPPRHPLGPALSHKHLEITSPRGVDN
ncbi:hypothetical protein J6590_103369 [Homalodisca vitripennis]|nr:hypothetical protein J6590_103369 [Homalodisca vitripennis]